MSKLRPDAIVIGGGISGLVAAWRLHLTGATVLVLEAKSNPGGNLDTMTVEGALLERGPHSFMAGAENIWRLVEELHLDEEVISASSAAAIRYVYRQGALAPAPMDPWTFLTTPLLSLRGKLRLMAEPFIAGDAKPDDNATTFFHRRFGDEAANYLAKPFVSGVYAGDPDILGARASFPKFWDFERDHGSMILGALRFMREKKKRLDPATPKRKGLYAFRQGFKQLVDELVRQLPTGSVKTDAPVESLSRTSSGWQVATANETWDCNSVVLAAPPSTAGRLLQPADSQAAARLSAIPMSPVALVHGLGLLDNNIPTGFGCLVPRHEGIRTLGVVFGNQLYPGRAPEGHWMNSSFLGGMLDKRLLEMDDKDILALADADRARLFGGNPARRQILLRYNEAVPQLLINHPEAMEEVQRRVARFPGLFLAGNYLTGVAVDHAVASGYRAAKDVGLYLLSRRERSRS